jgi:hypothetical protein
MNYAIILNRLKKFDSSYRIHNWRRMWIWHGKYNSKKFCGKQFDYTSERLIISKSRPRRQIICQDLNSNGMKRRKADSYALDYNKL